MPAYDTTKLNKLLETLVKLCHQMNEMLAISFIFSICNLSYSTILGQYKEKVNYHRNKVCDPTEGDQ